MFLVISQINTSADLNCSFESACRWRNDTSVEDSGDFPIASSVRVGNRFNIIPLKNGSNEMFAYTHGPFDGMQKATLISDTISCQLGGGSLAFWYYRTGDLATLEVCVRQPPSSLKFADLRCFPVFPKNHAHRWLLNVVEFPPLTQPFELLIRSHYIQPFDVIAIDDVFYDAALCGQSSNLLAEKLRTTDISYEPGRNQHMCSQRDAKHASHVPSSSSFASLPLIDYDNWKILKDSDVKPHASDGIETRNDGGNVLQDFTGDTFKVFPSSVIENRNKVLAKGPVEIDYEHEHEKTDCEF
uniref:MAM domain-containing protein n=1 Tax=Setaria digitata TaxID=48799 RepID=A0A915PPS3_9BILA